MIITKITFSKTIPTGPFGNDRPGVVEASLEPGETLESAWTELNKRAIAWHRGEYPHLYQDAGQPSTGVRYYTPEQLAGATPYSVNGQVIDYKKIEQFEKDIDNAQTSEELEAVVKSVETFPGRLLGVINVRRQALKAKQ